MTEAKRKIGLSILYNIHTHMCISQSPLLKINSSNNSNNNNNMQVS